MTSLQSHPPSHVPPPGIRRLAVPVGAAVVLIALAGTAWMAVRALAPGDGPVRYGTTELTLTAPIRDDVAYGPLELRNSGDEEAVIESVMPVDPPVGLDILDVQAADTRKLDEPTGATTGWLDESFRAAAGTRLPARATSSVEVAFVVRGTRRGRFGFDRTVVRYRIGDTRHELEIPVGLTLCAAAEGGSCT